VIITLLSSVWIFWLLLVQTQLLATGQIAVGPGLLVPSPTNEAVIGPGYLAVPFWYWIISIAVLVIVHEGSHGLMAAREKIRIKSLGWGLLAVIPLAFVEPDENQLKKEKPWKQLRVFAAGSFANYVTAAVSLALLAFTIFAFFVPAGVGYQSVMKGFPAANASLTGAITGINNYTIKDMSDLSRALTETGPDREIVVSTNNGTNNLTFTLTTAAEPVPVFAPDFYMGVLLGVEHAIPGTVDFTEAVSSGAAWISGAYKEPDWQSITYEIKLWEYFREKYPDQPARADQKIAELEKELESHPRSGYIGVYGVVDIKEIKAGLEDYEGSIVFLQGLFFFLFLINFAVGAFNMLPIGPLDGGRMWDIVIKRFTQRHSRRIMSAISWFVLLIIIADFVLVLV
jgi:membrane-associated protease RseP (regulator of RpoE activity)